MVLVGRPRQPPLGLGPVLLHQFALHVQQSQLALRPRVALLGGLSVPPDGLCGILVHALATLIGAPHGELRVGVVLVRRPPVQLRGFLVVARESRFALVVHAGEVVQPGGVVFFGGGPEPLERLFGIGRGQPVAVVVHHPQMVHRGAVALPGRRPEPANGFLPVPRHANADVIQDRGVELGVRVSAPCLPQQLLRDLPRLLRVGVAELGHIVQRIGIAEVVHVADHCRVEVGRVAEFVGVADPIALFTERSEEEPGGGMAGGGRDFEIAFGVGVVVHVHFQVPVEHPEVERRVLMARLRCRSVPPGRLFGILDDNVTIVVGVAEVHLGVGVALFRGGPEPVHRPFRVVPRAALAREIHLAETALGLRVSLLRQEEHARMGAGPVAALAALLRFFSLAGHGGGLGSGKGGYLR